MRDSRRGWVRWLAALCLLSCWLGSPVSVGAVELVIECESSLAETAQVVLTPLGEHPEVRPKVLELSLGEPRSVPLESASGWQVEAENEDCWLPSTVLDTESVQFEIAMMPAGRISFSIRAELRPSRIEVSFLDPRAEGQNPILQGACELEGELVSCAVPSGRRDLRVLAVGFAPVFFWDLRIERGKALGLGRLKLEPGASIGGWVEVAEGVDPSAVIEAKPARSGIPRSRTERNRGGLVSATATTDERGHFVVSGLEPGLYSLSARQGEHISAAVDIEIESAGRAVELDEALVLVPESRLSISLEPPVDPWGQPWSLEISKPAGEAGVYELVAKGSAAGHGSWTSPGLEPGTYSVEVYDAQGGVWQSGDISLSGGAERLFWALDVVPFRGSVRLGEEPLETEILFGEGSRAIIFESDEEGRFEGSLPRDGWWAVQLRVGGVRQAVDPVEIRQRAGASRAEVELELPATTLDGNVTQNGKAVQALVIARRIEPKAPVSVLESGVRRGSELTAWSNEEGEFRVRGIEPGRIELRASTRAAESDWIPVDLAEEQVAQVEIEIVERVSIRGRLVRSDAPLAGTKVFALFGGGVGATAVTDAAGAFELRLHGSIGLATLVVLPPGSGLSLASLDVSSSSDSVETVIEVPGGRGQLKMGIARLPEGEAIRTLSDLLPDGILYNGGAAVSVSQLSSLFPPSGSPFEGGIQLPAVAAGWWRYCPVSAPSECQEVQVFDGTSHLLQPESGVPDAGGLD